MQRMCWKEILKGPSRMANNCIHVHSDNSNLQRTNLLTSYLLYSILVFRASASIPVISFRTSYKVHTIKLRDLSKDPER